MRRMSTTSCKPGHVLAQPVVNERGIVVVAAGASLNETLLDRLQEMGVWHVFVDDDRYAGLEVLEPLTPSTYYPLRGYLRGLITSVREADDTADLGISARELMKWVDDVCDEIASLRKSFLLYPPEGPEEDRWMAHVINVSALSALTLRSIGGIAQARNLVAAAFLQDLGMWRIDPALREKLWRTKDPQAITEHVHESQRIVNEIRGISSIAKGIVAQHHERQDGSGHPSGRKGSEIHPLAGVIGVVDDYLGMIYDPRSPVLPHEAVEGLMAGVGYEYDHAPVKAFCAIAPVYPVGMEVELNTGESAVVIGSTPVAGRPIIKVLTDRTGTPAEPYEVNLSQATTQMIARVIYT